jgi:protein subunit release factor B
LDFLANLAIGISNLASWWDVSPINTVLQTRKVPIMQTFFCAGICVNPGLSFGRDSAAMVENDMVQRMKKLGIEAADLEETFARSSGPGGQHVNKVSTAVTLRHWPSGISVTVQDSRSQAVNRKLARERLLDAIERARKTRRAAEIAKCEKVRRQKSLRPVALKQRMLESKRKRGELKKQRAKIELD